jgi:glycosyltransferase involved in cell wall biosynthesis
VLMVTNTDWYFTTHRLPHAERAVEAGMDVHVATADSGWGAHISARPGVNHHPIDLGRGAPGARKDLAALRQLNRLVDQLRPDVLHLIAARAVVLGGLVSRRRAGMTVVYSITGQGYMPALSGGLGLAERAYQQALRSALHRRNSWTIFQTHHDRDTFVEGGLLPRHRAVLIPGVGVDPDQWVLPPLAQGPPIVVYAGRLIREKGVHDLVDAIRLLRPTHPKLHLILAGAIESELPTAVSREELAAWRDEGLVDYQGHLSDIRPVLQRATLLALPSYHREGIPKILLEAAAAGVPLIAGATPGCTEVVEDQVTGLLVPPRRPEVLAEAIERLLSDQDLATRLRRNARKMVVDRFTLDEAATRTLQLYRGPPESCQSGSAVRVETGRSR